MHGVSTNNQSKTLMTDKYQNKYRIASARAPWWDYGRHAAYFVTICTKHMQHSFCHIDDGVMHVSKIGKITQTEWLKTPEIRPDMNLELGSFVVMPNHFHAIIIIGENQYNTPTPDCRDAMHRVSTTNTETTSQNSFGPQSKNLASIIRGFKSAVTKTARQIRPDFAWQPRFHDHIIRDEKSFQTISEYIINNPLKWKDDKFYTEGKTNS